MKKRRILGLIASAVLLLGSPVLAEVDYGNPTVIRQVQQALNEAGFDCGTPDGVIGPATRGGISAYRAARSLPAGEGIDKELYESLGLAALLPYSYTELESDEEIDSLPETQLLLSSIAKIILLNRMDNGQNESVGNYEKEEDIIRLDVLYRMNSGKNVVFSCRYDKETDPVWQIQYAVDLDTGHYYYLDEEQAGTRDLYDYRSGELKEKAAVEKAAEETKKTEEVNGA